MRTYYLSSVSRNLLQSLGFRLAVILSRIQLVVESLRKAIHPSPPAPLPKGEGRCEGMRPVRSLGLQYPQKPFRIIVGRVTSRGVWMQALFHSRLQGGQGPGEGTARLNVSVSLQLGIKHVFSLLLSLLFLHSVLVSNLYAEKPRPKPKPLSFSRELLLSGEDWKLGAFAFDEGERCGAFAPKFDDSGFRTVKVPGEVQLQIGLQGMDLYYQSKELTLVNEKEWWYRKGFVASPQNSGKTVRLVLEGVDYFATVWLNGEKLGEHEGCYVPFSYDVSSKLNYGKENQLSIKVTCP